MTLEELQLIERITPEDISHWNYAYSLIDTKQNALVSGENFSKINGYDLLNRKGTLTYCLTGWHENRMS